MIVCTLDPDDAAAATRALAAFASVARLASQVIVESEHDRAALVRLLVAAGLDDVARRTTTRPPVVVGDPPQEDLASRRGREDAGALAALADDGARRERLRVARVVVARFDGEARSRPAATLRTLRLAVLGGVPCVTVDVAGAGEIVRHGVTGYVSRSDDAAHLAAAAAKLERDDVLWRRFSRAARAP